MNTVRESTTYYQDFSQGEGRHRADFMVRDQETIHAAAKLLTDVAVPTMWPSAAEPSVSVPMMRAEKVRY